MLTARKRAFIDYYKSAECAGNASKAAVMAGFSPRNVNRTASRLLKDVDINRQLKEFEQERKEKYSKENYIDTAWKQFEDASTDKPVKPRYLEIAGKALGYLKSDNGVNVNVLVSTNSIERMREFLNKRGKIINPIETESKLDVNRQLSIAVNEANALNALNTTHTASESSSHSTPCEKKDAETPADGKGQGAPATP